MEEFTYLPHVICYDQEPLTYNLYTDVTMQVGKNFNYPIDQATLPKKNLRVKPGNIYDQCLLIHSERNSPEVLKYQLNQFVPVYYWSHAIIARDWFRYAPYVNFTKDTKKTFLIYNRAWSGTREYRLKFTDLLIENNLLDLCKTHFNPYDNNCFYKDHKFNNARWAPIHQLENYLDPTLAPSCYSADFDISDYNSTEIEIVLETLFDDQRHHLTEKILRPIACQQPFILASTPGSLEYLRSYGFQTFGEIFDESYDSIQDPVERLKSIINAMKEIANWGLDYKLSQLKKINKITTFNQQHFFSDKFLKSIVKELKTNLISAFDYIENNNIGLYYRDPHVKNIPGVRQCRQEPTMKQHRMTALNVLKKYRKRNRTKG